MKRKIYTAVALSLALMLLLSAGALAMSSPGFLLDWYVQLSGGGRWNIQLAFLYREFYRRAVCRRADIWELQQRWLLRPIGLLDWSRG